MWMSTEQWNLLTKWLTKWLKVLLVTAHRRRDYMQAKEGRVAKFMPRYDGPYIISEAYPKSLISKLEWSRVYKTTRQHPVFHTANVWIKWQNALSSGREMRKPGPIVTENGNVEFYSIERIIDERQWGRGPQYLVRWKGYGQNSDLWLPRSELMETASAASRLVEIVKIVVVH